jgi:hypothetical protein
VYLRGELQQTITGMTKGKLYRVRFYTSHLPIWEAYVANKEGFVMERLTVRTNVCRRTQRFPRYYTPLRYFKRGIANDVSHQMN